MTRHRHARAGTHHRSSQRELEQLFEEVNAAALPRLASLCATWLSGRRIGREFVALNPTRQDRHLGSFSINIKTGCWADFATDDRGGDPISLYAYLNGLSQLVAARELAGQLGVRT